MSKVAHTLIEVFLAPLAHIARTVPEIEGLVFWGGAEGWDGMPSEALEAEEITFYAEGLLLDGFRMQWWLLARTASPNLPDHLRLLFWQDQSPPPAVPEGWVALDDGDWAEAGT